MLQASNEFRVFCHKCNRYTKQDSPGGNTKPSHNADATYRCGLCGVSPTIYNLQFSIELYREFEGEDSVHPHFIKPLFKAGQVCLIRNLRREAYAHCKIYGMRYIELPDRVHHNWEYYVSIYGQNDFEWIREENLQDAKSPVF